MVPDRRRTRKATDLSFTYHIIAYRQGDVRFWDRIVATTLALEGQEYPFGWRYQGELTNHNAYDVVRILQPDGRTWTRRSGRRRQRRSSACCSGA